MKIVNDSILDDRYQIIVQLSTGDLLFAFKAYDTRLERFVALKVIRTDNISQEQQNRLMAGFDREAKTQAGLNHRHIVPVFDYGFYEDSPYLVMGYVPGGTLRARAAGKVSWERAIRWLIPITEALSYAHNRGVVHRDVKPTNILFDEVDQPVLTDFGIVNMFGMEEKQLTGTGLGVGTPGYMAPEQWRGKTSPHTDQYALGVILYELVTGEKPYQGGTPVAIAIKQVTELVRDPREFEPDIPGGVAKIIMRMLARQPQNRYESMDALHGALKQPLKQFSGIANKTEERNQILISKTKASDTTTTTSPKAATAGEFEKHRESNQDEEQSSSLVKELRNDQDKKVIPAWMMWLGGSVMIVCLVGLLIGALTIGSGRFAGVGVEGVNPTETLFVNQVPETAAELDLISTIEPTESPEILTTPEPTMTEEAIVGVEITQEIELDIGSTMINLVDGAVMMFVPSGEFLMGTDDVFRGDNEKPAHLVYLDAYWIFQTEVTNSQYRQCILSGACRGSLDYYLDNNFPAENVNWNRASEYCTWADARLPTEAEWEKAARGTDGRTYPWGNEYPDCSRGNHDLGLFGPDGRNEFCEDDIQEVGSYPLGASPYGVLDTFGSIWEWVADWYDEDYYNRSPYENPTGPATGEYRVIRGGDWGIRGLDMWVTLRGYGYSGVASFRCARTQ